MNKIVALIATTFLVLAVGCGSDADDSRTAMNKSSGTFTLQSNNFIPEHGSPDFSWRNAPDGTKSFAIIIDDHTASNYLHWSVFNINAKLDHIDSQNTPMGSLESSNQTGTIGYEDPQARGIDEYVGHIYALDIDDITHIEGKSIDNVVNKIYNHEEFEADFAAYILGEAEVTTLGRDLPITEAIETTTQENQPTEEAVQNEG